MRLSCLVSRGLALLYFMLQCGTQRTAYRSIVAYLVEPIELVLLSDMVFIICVAYYSCENFSKGQVLPRTYNAQSLLGPLSSPASVFQSFTEAWQPILIHM